MLARVPLASYKIRFADEHVRAVPRTDAEGCPFAGPGVDLRGEDARRAMELTAGLQAWLVAREPGVVIRSIVVDRTRPRVLLTLAATREGDAKPRALRFDSPFAEELTLAAAPAEAAIEEACARALARRRQR